jgi:hypothetical protein
MTSTVFNGRLTPLPVWVDARRAAIRPVSRVSFELSDTTAFEQSIVLALRWMEPRARVRLPADAWGGQAFDVTDILGANPAKAVRIDASDGVVWAARLDFPDPNYPRTWVSEFFSEKRRGALARFGAQLTCVVRGECPPYETTRPNVVRDIIETLSAEADGWALSETATKLDNSDISSFESLLYEPSRRLPIVAISESEDRTIQIEPDSLAKKIAGAAHIVHLSVEDSWALTRALGRRMSVFNGAVRLYLPGLSEANEDPYEHPLWLKGNDGSDELVRNVAARVLPSAFLRSSGPEDFLRFSVLRDVATRHALSTQLSRNAEDQVRVELDALKSEFRELEEDRDTWRGLAIGEQDRSRAFDTEIERLKAETVRLAAKAAALEYQLESKSTPAEAASRTPRRLNSYDELEDWAEEVLGEQIQIHPAALKDCKKNGHDNMLNRIKSALLVIRDYAVPARIQGGLESHELARKKFGELGMDDKASFVDRNEAKRTPGYSVQYNGQTRILYDHIKYGNGYDNANQIRIYYFWDEVDKRFVIGKMPSHLKNNLTS